MSCHAKMSCDMGNVEDSKVNPSEGQVSKPIKPSIAITPIPHNQVAPVKPQLSTSKDWSIRTSALTSVQNSVNSSTTMLTKTTSPTQSLNHSNLHRRRSGARHSSPIKKSVTIISPRSNIAAENDLSKLLDSTATPSLRLTTTSHLTTSTPYHNNLNLSTVILDHVTKTLSYSHLINIDKTISPTNLDVSSICPAMYTSLVRL